MGFSDALLDLIESFLENRFISGQTSEWLPVEISVPKGSILGCLFFLICINDLSVDIIPTITLLANDTSLFSIIYDAKTIAYGLKNICKKIAEWAHHSKMLFNPDLNKQAQEVIFSRKITKSSHSQISFNNVRASRASFQKY